MLEEEHNDRHKQNIIFEQPSGGLVFLTLLFVQYYKCDMPPLRPHSEKAAPPPGHLYPLRGPVYINIDTLGSSIVNRIINQSREGGQQLPDPNLFWIGYLTKLQF